MEIKGNINWVTIRFKAGQTFEKEHGHILPTYVFVDSNNGIHTIKIPSYCLDVGNNLKNNIMHELYPQHSKHDFESGQV